MTIDELVKAMNEALAKKDLVAFERYDSEHRKQAVTRNAEDVSRRSRRYAAEDFTYFEGYTLRVLATLRIREKTWLHKQRAAHALLKERLLELERSLACHEAKLMAIEKYLRMEEEREEDSAAGEAPVQSASVGSEMPRVPVEQQSYPSSERVRPTVEARASGRSPRKK